MSSTEGGGTTQTGAPGAAERLGFKPGMVIQELGWDSDTDDQLRVAIEDAIDADMVDSDYGNVVDAVVLWWRSEDGDLVDGLVDALTDLVGGGAIWLFTPRVGRPNAVEPADIAEAAPIAAEISFAADQSPLFFAAATVSRRRSCTAGPHKAPPVQKAVHSSGAIRAAA